VNGVHYGTFHAASAVDVDPVEVHAVHTTALCHGTAGMMAAATYVHSNTAGALAAAGRDFPGWPLFLTGHSMGGARPIISTVYQSEFH
jgi:alpha-beta hydrolase superfamily lysophospholipase